MLNQLIQTIDVNALKSKMDTQPDLCLIDVREINEWNRSRIPHAIHIAKSDLPTQIESHVSNKNQPIYLHCQGGVRSLAAAQCLMDLGYSEVYSIDGGIMDWAASGYPVLT